jgi:putative polyhydroxyalkanoate system protein
MSSIEITHLHSLSGDAARVAVQDMVDKLTERFGMKSNWLGDVLNFSGSGVDGAISLLPGSVQVSAKLGFLASAMKPMIESEIQRVLKEKLG